MLHTNCPHKPNNDLEDTRIDPIGDIIEMIYEDTESHVAASLTDCSAHHFDSAICRERGASSPTACKSPI